MRQDEDDNADPRRSRSRVSTRRLALFAPLALTPAALIAIPAGVAYGGTGYERYVSNSCGAPNIKTRGYLNGKNGYGAVYNSAWAYSTCHFVQNSGWLSVSMANGSERYTTTAAVGFQGQKATVYANRVWDFDCFLLERNRNSHRWNCSASW